MKRPSEGIATDGAHSRKRGATRYQAVDLATGELLFSRDIGNRTINIAEFLGVVEALKYIIENDHEPRIVYTDSLTAIAWVREKGTASVKKSAEMKKAEVFLKVMSEETKRVQIVHWNKNEWGEIPADFKKKRRR